MAQATLLSVLIPVLAASPGISVAYLWFALSIGPRLMRGREPVQPKPLLVIYNAVQVVINVALLWRSIVMFLDRRYNVGCPRSVPRLDVFSVEDLSGADAFDLEITRVAHYQASLRMLDLADTVFLVLAKKDSHLSFLHLYHHSSVIIFSWLILLIDAGAAATLVPAAMNNFVHAIMYTYYLLSLFGSQTARACKRYITQLQILQFIFVLLYMLQAILRTNCDTSIPIVALNISQGLVFLGLFTQFYRSSYQSKKAV